MSHTPLLVSEADSHVPLVEAPHIPRLNTTASRLDLAHACLF